MQFSSVTASPAVSGLATMSNYFFTTAVCMLVVMTLAYLWYTIGSVRLSQRVAVERARSRSLAQKQAKQARQVKLQPAVTMAAVSPP